jgi:hypothetical protein
MLLWVCRQLDPFLACPCRETSQPQAMSERSFREVLVFNAAPGYEVMRAHVPFS